MGANGVVHLSLLFIDFKKEKEKKKAANFLRNSANNTAQFMKL